MANSNNHKAAAVPQRKDTGGVEKVRYSLSESHNGALFEDDRCTNEGPSFPSLTPNRARSLRFVYSVIAPFTKCLKLMWDKRGGN